LWGLGAAMAVILALSGWLYGSVSRDLAGEQKQREAVLLANAVAASLGGAGEAEIGERVQSWKAELPNVESVRVVAGRQLLASTIAKDEAPRPLQREEKPLFDLATLLRSAGETNVAEGAPRKKTIQVDDDRTGVVTVSVPYVVDGQFEGIVQARIKPQDGAVKAPGGWGLPLALLAAALAIGAVLRFDPDRRFDAIRGLALVVLVGLAAYFQMQRLSQMAEATVAADAAVAKVQAAAAAVYGRSGRPKASVSQGLAPTATAGAPLRP
jgi:hypothetical protein